MYTAKRWLTRALPVIGLIVAVLATVIIASHGSHKKQTTLGSASASPSATVSSSASATQATLPSPSQASDPAISALEQEASSFMENYYLLTPSDSYATRLARMKAIKPPIPTALLKQLDLNVYTTSTSDQARIKLQLTQKGVISGIAVQTMNGHPDARNVLSQITISGYTPDGKVAGKSTTELNASIWQQDSSGVWTCIYFAVQTQPGVS